MEEQIFNKVDSMEIKIDLKSLQSNFQNYIQVIDDIKKKRLELERQEKDKILKNKI